MIFEAEILIDLKKALVVEELAIEVFGVFRVTEKTEHGAADFLIIEEGRKVEVFGPEACAFGDEQGVDDVGEHFMYAGLTDEVDGVI